MESISNRPLAPFRNPETTLEYAEGKTLKEVMIMDGMKNDIHASQKRIENAAILEDESHHSPFLHMIRAAKNGCNMAR